MFSLCTKRESLTVIICLLLFLVLGSMSVQADNSSTDWQHSYLDETPPGNIPIKFAAGSVSTGQMETRLVISPDNSELFFCRESYLYHAERLDNNSWSEPKIASFSGKDVDGEACFSADGQTLFFCSRRPHPQKAADLNVWVSHKRDGSWSDAEPVAGAINSKTVHTPTVTANGDIFASGLVFSKLTDGSYSAATKLSPNIKGYRPFVALDGSFILFDGKDPGSYKKKLRIAFRKANNSWTKGEALNETINATGTEGNPSVTADGKFLFFTRQHDIYWISAEFIGELKTKALTTEE